MPPGNPVIDRLRRACGRAALVGACVAGIAAPVAGEDAAAPAAPPPLPLERLYEDPPLVTGGPAIASWRPPGPRPDAAAPARDTWVEWRTIEGRRTLVEVDAEKGTATPRPATAGVEALRERDERAVPMRGIGRAGPVDHAWADDGNVLFLPADGDVVRVDLAHGTRQRMTRTASPIADVRPSPDGTAVAFSRDADLHVARLEGDVVVERALTRGGSADRLHATLDWVYPEELDVTTAIQWSPDSRRLAFLRLDETGVPRVEIGDPIPLHGAVVAQRYPKAGDRNPVATVGVVAVEGGEPTWLDPGLPGETYVPWFAWTPDACRVLVAVLTRDQTRFDVVACDPGTGARSTWWSETEPRWVDAPPPPRFLRDGAALLRSRRDGWWRLYLVPADGSAPRPLSPPRREVGALLAVDEEARAAFVEVEDLATLRTQVLRVPLDGGDATTVTDPATSHGARFSPSGRLFVDAASRLDLLTRHALRRADGTEVRPLATSETAAMRALALPAPTLRTLRTDPALVACVRVPRAFDPARRWPVVAHVYGGPGSRTVRDVHGGVGFDAVLAEAGFVVLAVDGRGTAGRGKDHEATVHRRLGTCELEDLVTAVELLAREPWFDRERVGVWGWSYGGTFAALAAARAPTTFRAAAAVAPVTDWALYDTIYTERYMDLPAENAAGYRDAAVTSFAKDVSGALLLAHGLADDNVHAQNTWRLVDALVAAGRPFDLQAYPQRGHGIEGTASRLHLHRRILEHFRRHLGAGPR